MPRPLCALVFLLLAATPLAAEDSVPVRAAPVAVFAEQTPDQTVFGDLRFLGGVQLESPDNRFGGLSGIEISGDGRTALLISDQGDLFSATLDYDNGVLTGLSGVTVSRLTGADGKPLTDKYRSDAESLRSVDGNGLSDDVIIGFERDNRAFSYRIDANGRPEKATPLTLPEAVKDLPYNKGLEGIAVIPQGAPNAGAIVAFGESESESTPGVIPGWLITNGKARDLGLTRTSGFDLTDIVALPGGDLIVLERHFSMFLGVAMRVRRISAAELDGPQPMSGTTLLTAGMAHAVDNMEGVAVHRDDAGRTILTIVSDDNFSALQRTLILQFELL